MGVERGHLGAAGRWTVAAVFAAFLLGTVGSRWFDSRDRAAVAEEDASGRAGIGTGPAGQAMPALTGRIAGPGGDIRSVWTALPAGVRGGDDVACVYDNGAPLDDFGDPASQLSEEPAPPLWQFIAAAADDFELVDLVSPETHCRITTVRSAFVFFNSGSEDATPLRDWDGIFVTVYANDPVWNEPDGEPDENGGHTGNVVASQYVPVEFLLNETEVGICRRCFMIDIPVDIILEKNTRYWLSLVPRFPAPPQSAWCVSESADLGFASMRGASFGDPFWTEAPGNHGCPNAAGCPSECAGVENPPAGTNKELAFVLIGVDTELDPGACCDESTGICSEVMLESECSGAHEVFTPGSTCETVTCEAIVGACCDDEAASCSEAILADCQGPGLRFSAGVDCEDLDPPCGTVAPGGCCFTGATAPDMAMAAANQVSLESYRDFLDNWLYTHLGDDRGIDGPEHDLARDNIELLFEDYGLDVSLEPFTYADTTYYNVVGTQLGTRHPDQIYLVGAHFDSVGNPGADDNASGVVLLLEAARIITQYDSEYTIRFIAFDREEQGLIGSSAYASDHGGDAILGMISTDMVAYDPDTDHALIYGRTSSNSIKTALGEAIDLYSGGLTYSDQGWNGQSDHAPFDAAGFQACLMIEGEVWNNPYYHSPEDSVDTPGYINYTYAVAMTRSIVGYLVDWAGVNVPVEGLEQYCDDLSAVDCAAGGGIWHEDLCEAIDCPPDNDACEAAIDISGDGVVRFSTNGASTDGPSPSGCGDINQDVWFRYTAACDGDLTASLCGDTDYDSVMAIYEGCACEGGPGPEVGCDDDGCGTSNGPSRVTVAVTAGQCYLIRIGGAGAATGTGYLVVGCVPAEAGACCLPEGACQIMLEDDCLDSGGAFSGGEPCSPWLCPPANDDCDAATTVGDGVHAFDTLGATTDGPAVSPEPTCTDVNQDIWFDYEATCTGELTVSLCFEAGYDTALAVYAGDACPTEPASEIACDDDGCGFGTASEIALTVNEGESYKIRVGGAGSAGGTGYLVIGCVPPGEGACCLADGTCTMTASEEDCLSLGGVFTAEQACSPITCPEPDDDCLDAVAIVDGVYAFDTTEATTDGPDDSPGGFCADVNQDIWFAYTATCDGVLVASLCQDTDYDASMSIYEAEGQGCTCPPTNMVGCDNDACAPEGPSEVEVLVTEGTCYLLRIGGVGTAAGTGTLVVGCIPEDEGACCHDDFTCEVLLGSECEGDGDVFTPGEPCSMATCPPPVVDCCPGDANADGVLDGGDIGLFVELLLNPPDLGTIQFCWANVEDSDLVIDMNDIPPFVQKLLDGEACPAAATGACCLADGSCSEVTAALCAFLEGSYHGDDSICEPGLCPQPPAACCFADDGGCQELDPDECGAAGGVYQGVDTTCEPNPCPQPPAACCFHGGDCQVLDSEECSAAGGTYQGIDTTCEPNLCPLPVVCCIGDTNGDSVLDGSDVAFLVDALLDPPELGTLAFCRADLNEDLVIDEADIGPFVQQLLAGETCGPVNDDCAAAEPISCNTPVTVDNTFATTDPIDPAFSCRSGGPAQGIGTVWFEFTASGPDAMITTCDSEAPVTDTLIAVYDSAGACLATFDNEIACSEDAFGDCDRLAQVCVTDLVEGSTYYIQAASFDEQSRGLLTLEVICPCPIGACCLGDGSCQETTADACDAADGVYQGDGTGCDPDPCPPPQPPANDDCASPQPILCNAQATVDNTLATTDPSDPAFSCRFGGPAQGVGTLWLEFTAVSTDAQISTCNSQMPVFDTLIAVYDGAGACVATSDDEIACSEDECGRLSEVCVSGLTPGTTYYVQVASWGEDSRGEITIDLTCPCP